MTDAQAREYVFDGVTYVQRPLVLGQVRQMIHLLQGTAWRQGGGVQAILEALGDKIGHALAVVLTEKGKSPRDKDLDALAEKLEYAVTPEELLQVIDDFFYLNPVPSLLERLTTIMESVATGTIGTETGSTSSSSSSQEETSPGGTG